MLAISLAGYVALSPEILTLKYRILFIGLAVGGISGLIGTATRLESADLIPVNIGYGIAVAVVVTTVLHVIEAVLKGRHLFRA